MLDENEIVRKVLKFVIEQLALTADDMAEIIGCHPSEIDSICVDIEMRNIALRFLRMYESLDVLWAGHTENMRGWFKCHNTRLGGVPMDLCRTPDGLEQVTRVLEAYRYNNI